MFSIIIPAHNEEKRIGKTLESYGRFFRGKKEDFEMIVVINNTQDRTEEIVKKYSKKYSEIKYLNFEEGGKGFAIIEGFKESLRGDSKLIGFVDGDMSTPPGAFYDLIKKIGNYDGIIANRWDKKSVINLKQNTIRRIISRVGNLIIRTLFLFNYKDTQCGAKLFKKEILEKSLHKLVTSNWGFDIALLFCLKKESKAKIKSIPTTWNDDKDSKLDVKRTPFLVLASVIRLRLIHSPFKFLVRLYRILPAKWKFH